MSRYRGTILVDGQVVDIQHKIEASSIQSAFHKAAVDADMKTGRLGKTYKIIIEKRWHGSRVGHEG